jgi:hypothetical protein
MSVIAALLKFINSAIKGFPIIIFKRLECPAYQEVGSESNFAL